LNVKSTINMKLGVGTFLVSVFIKLLNNDDEK